MSRLSGPSWQFAFSVLWNGKWISTFDFIFFRLLPRRRETSNYYQRISNSGEWSDDDLKRRMARYFFAPVTSGAKSPEERSPRQGDHRRQTVRKCHCREVVIWIVRRECRQCERAHCMSAWESHRINLVWTSVKTRTIYSPAGALPNMFWQNVFQSDLHSAAKGGLNQRE